MTRFALIVAILIGLNLVDRSNFNGRFSDALRRQMIDRYEAVKSEIGH